MECIKHSLLPGIELPNPLVDLCVQGEVGSGGGAEVGELADSIEFVVVDGNDRRCFCVLSQDLRLLQTAAIYISRRCHHETFVCLYVKR